MSEKAERVKCPKCDGPVNRVEYLEYAAECPVNEDGMVADEWEIDRQFVDVTGTMYVCQKMQRMCGWRSDEGGE